jgi:lambda family phage portal protein
MAGILALSYRHMLIDGESTSLSHWIEGRGDWCTAIQIIDPDRLSNPWMYMDSVERKHGVELGVYGEPKGYWFRTAHPGDLGVIGAYPWRWEYFDKKYPNGRWQVIHSFRPNRAGQVSGEPPLAPILRKVRMITKYDNAELQAAVLNALLAAFIQSPNDPDQIAQSLEGDDNLSPLQNHRLGFYEKSGVRLPNVKLNFLYPNDVVNLLQPKHPNPNFESFFRVGLRNLAAVSGITYEQISGDYSTTNYSSARAGLLEVWRGFTARSSNHAALFMRPHYENWLEEAFANGQVKVPAGAPAFREAKNAYTNANWVGPPRGYIDPQKEALAAITRVSGRMSTLQAECQEQGLDWREVLQQLARERKEMLALGLDPDLLVQAALPRGVKPGGPEPQEPGEASTSTPSREDVES